MPGTNSKVYIKELDAIRALAIITVMVSHFVGQFWFISMLGTYGVTLFFVLSGFLITRILIVEKQKLLLQGANKPARLLSVLKTFYIRRTLRIFPLYYAVLLLLLVLNIDSIREYWHYYFFYFSNYINSYYTSYDRLSHFWSLAVEEQFYLLWPLLILLIPVRWLKIYFFILLALLSLVFKFWLLFTSKSWAWYYLMPACIESFSIGAIVLLLKDRFITPQKLYLFLGLAILFSCSLFVISYLNHSLIIGLICGGLTRFFSSIVFGIFLLMVIKGCFFGTIKKILNNKILLLLGKISYGIYIYHMFVPGLFIFFLNKLGSGSPGVGVQIGLNFLLTICIAYCSFIFFEAPVNNLKRKFAYQRSSSGITEVR